MVGGDNDLIIYRYCLIVGVSSYRFFAGVAYPYNCLCSLLFIFLTNLKLVKPIKWAIHCGQAVEIYQYDI